MLPVWILAIARKREQQIGRMCLPQNDLMTIAENFFDVPSDVQPGPTVLELHALYVRQYGNQTNFYEAWDKYLSSNGT